MPASPELLRILRLVRRIEVLGQVEANQHCDTDGDVRVTGEVCIDLHGVAEQRKQVLKAREKQRVVKHTVNEIDGEIVAEDNLLRQAVEHPEHRYSELPASEVEGSV